MKMALLGAAAIVLLAGPVLADEETFTARVTVGGMS